MTFPLMYLVNTILEYMDVRACVRVFVLNTKH